MTPDLSAAIAALNGFASRLPPSTVADAKRLAGDFATALKAELNAAIAADAPQIPIVRPLIVREMQTIAGATIDAAINSIGANQ